MKINKPYFWNIKHNFIVYLLLPLSLLITIYIFLKKKITKTLKFKIPIICIGNIYVGGTGKTPTSILIAREISNLGFCHQDCQREKHPTEGINKIRETYSKTTGF